MNDLQIFKNEQFGEIRAIEINSKTYLGATDSAKALGYADAINAIKQHCKKDGVVKHHVIDSMGRTQQMNFITEGNLYRLISKSQLPGAEKFESWIFDEVLPTIRKHGAYMTTEKLEEVLLNPDAMIKILTELKKEREEKQGLQLENKQKDQIIGELKPKADYMDSILRNKGLVTITQIAKDYGMSGNKMNELLHKLNVQYKQSGQWLLYIKYHDKGYTHSETVDIIRSNGMEDVKMNTKWTQKGRLFLYDLLKEHEVLPIIEQRNFKAAGYKN
ncbi:phage antirepressor KilAC domain-containing protein [Clostridium sp.]|uniref:phage antirepressor KilAC domain-containing protein n=1 Tax=Clostridium sp. TaxID=1506 RepID=UPI001A44C112|nr:phage antirepressor KilAC domain-containing protein [Clostridium sp.]MBK5237445.1 phage antirepressor KilAC domain-containing protein [Clostridium sp.]